MLKNKSIRNLWYNITLLKYAITCTYVQQNLAMFLSTSKIRLFLYVYIQIWTDMDKTRYASPFSGLSFMHFMQIKISNLHALKIVIKNELVLIISWMARTGSAFKNVQWNMTFNVKQYERTTTYCYYPTIWTHQ